MTGGRGQAAVSRSHASSDEIATTTAASVQHSVRSRVIVPTSGFVGWNASQSSMAAVQIGANLTTPGELMGYPSHVAPQMGPRPPPSWGSQTFWLSSDLRF
jgi:hypothetical protein